MSYLHDKVLLRVGDICDLIEDLPGLDVKEEDGKESEIDIILLFFWTIETQIFCVKNLKVQWQKHYLF